MILIAGGLFLGILAWIIWQQRSRKVVGLAIGVFDCCHQGHVNLLLQAADCCDHLIVGVHPDAAVLQDKDVQPANSEKKRAASIESLGIASEVIIENDRTLLCRKNRVNIVFYGDNIQFDVYREHWGEDLIDELGIDIVMLCHTPGIK